MAPSVSRTPRFTPSDLFVACHPKLQALFARAGHVGCVGAAPQRPRLHSERRTTQSAFTLIELLVVVAVIAILAAMLLPVLGRAKFRANMTVCLNNIRQTYMALHMYGDDYEGWFPLADEGGAWPAQPPNYYSSSWGDAGPPGVLQTCGYVSYQVVHCPGTGSLSNFGWPKPGWGPMDYFLAYDFVQLRRCDLWVGPSWRQDMRWSNSWAGGLILRCLTVNNEGDPRLDASRVRHGDAQRRRMARASDPRAEY